MEKRKWVEKSCTFFKKILFFQFDWLKLIAIIPWKYIIIFYMVIFLLGRIFLYYDPLRFDLIHQLLLTGISFIVISSLKYANKIADTIEKTSSNTKNNTHITSSSPKTMSTIIKNMRMTQKSVWWLLLMLYPLKGFVRKLFYMGYIQYNPTGYYAAAFGSSTFYIAMLGYVQVIIFILYFAQIAHDRDGCIQLNFPADSIAPPAWFYIWDDLLNKIISLFFCTGTLFTLEYILLMPSDLVIYDGEKYILNPQRVSDPYIFFSSWATIVIFIIIAFPIGLTIIRYLQKELVKNINKKIALQYKKQTPKKVSKKTISCLWRLKYLSLKPTIYGEAIRTEQNIIPIISTVLSLLINVYKVYDSKVVFILLQNLKTLGI